VAEAVEAEVEAASGAEKTATTVRATAGEIVAVVRRKSGSNTTAAATARAAAAAAAAAGGERDEESDGDIGGETHPGGATRRERKHQLLR
jgi:hypothetical protein